MNREEILQIDELNARAYQLRNSNPTEARKLANEASKLSLESDYKRGFGCALRTRAVVELNTDLTGAFEHAVKAIEILLTEEDGFEACSVYPTLYVYYEHTGQRELACAAITRCLELAEKSGNRAVEAIGRYNFGFLLADNQQVDDARRELQIACQLSRELKDYSIYGHSLAELARIFAAQQSGSFPYQELLDVLDLLKQHPEQNGLAQVLRAQMLYLHAIGEHAPATIAYRSARQAAKRTQNWREYLSILRTKAEIEKQAGRLNRSRRALATELATVHEHKVLIGEADCLLRLAKVETELGDHKSANQHLYEHIEAKQKLHCLDTEARHRELEVIHRTEQHSKSARTARQQVDALDAVNQHLHFALERQTELQKELMRLATTDDLTGAFNRRQVINDGSLEMERYRHTGAPFTVSVIDIDHFKSINDTFGHAIGDEVLRRLTKAAQAILRRFDIFGRLGGEEFCILHHDSDIAGATKAVERLQKAVSSLFVADILDDRTLTVSIGIAEVRREDNSFFDVLHQADLALYEAKRSGRNTFRVAQSRFLEAA